MRNENMMKLCESAVFVCAGGEGGEGGEGGGGFQPRGERLEKRTPRISFPKRSEKVKIQRLMGAFFEFLDRERFSLSLSLWRYILVP